MTKWDQFDFKNNIHEPMQGKVYQQMNNNFSHELTRKIYRKLRGPLSLVLFINLSIVMDDIGHRTKWVKRG